MWDYKKPLGTMFVVENYTEEFVVQCSVQMSVCRFLQQFE